MRHLFFTFLVTVALLVNPEITLAENVERLYQQGNAAQEAGNFFEAERIFRRVIQIRPKDAEAYYKLGVALGNQGKLDSAIAAFQKAIQLNPNYAEAYNNLGVALGRQGKLEQAINAYKKAIELNPNYAAAYNGLGTVLYNQNKVEEAIAAFQKAIELKPNYVFAYNNLGNALRQQGKLDEAIAAYEKAIELNPNDAGVYNSLGNALTEHNKLDEAIAAYEKAIELAPNNAGAYNNLGNALRQQGKLDEAIVICRKALTLPENKTGIRASAHTLAHNCLGLALQQQGRLEEAIAEFQSSVALDYNYIPAQNNLKEAQRLLNIQRNPPPVAIDDRGYLPPEADEPLVKILRSTPRIIAKAKDGNISIGAGWVVKREGETVWIVTNRHVINDNKTRNLSDNVAVEFFSELQEEQRPRYVAQIEQSTDANDYKLDLAVLKVTGIPSDIQSLECYPGRVRRNTRVTVIGHPYTVDRPWTSVSGEVINFNPQNHLLTINANVAQGNSGGPVINEQGQVIAVMVKLRTNQDPVVNADVPTPDLSDISPATGGVGLAYRIDIVVEKLREWRIFS